MHELPPMQHMRRATVIDVHHAILPETAAVRPDPARLRAGARAVPGAPGLYVLAPCAGRLTPVADAMLYIRGNWLRMPPLMLSRHLFHKAFLTSGNVKSRQV